MKYCADYIKNILARHGKVLKKSLGQNFLYNKDILDKIVGASVVNNQTNIVEIGAGVGLLTDLLCQKAKKVVTIEIDNSLPPLLKETVPHSNFFLHLQDVLQVEFSDLAAKHFAGEKFTLVGNLPYYITTKILDRLMQYHTLLDSAVIMVQREVAARLQSAPGSKEYRSTTLCVQTLFEIETICPVAAHNFVPPPHVESAVIRLTPKENSGISPTQTARFLAFAQAAFAARRKQLKGVAKALGSTPEKMLKSLTVLGVSENVRAEALTPKQMVDLFNLLF